MPDERTTVGSNKPGPTSWVLAARDVENLLEQVVASREVVIDLETTGLVEHATTGGSLNGGVAGRVALAALTLPMPDERGEWDGIEPTTYIWPLSHRDSPFLGTWRPQLTRLCQALLDHAKPLNNQNMKFDARWLYAMTGVDLSHLIVWDTEVSSSLLDETRSRKLKERAPETFDVPRWDDDMDFTKPGAAERADLMLLGEYACIAEGQKVLTHLGAVPIQEVTTGHLLWDGVEWVSHEGVIFKGTLPVLELDNGLTGTSDHLILTEQGDYSCLGAVKAGIRRAASPESAAARGGLLDPDRTYVAGETPPSCGGDLRPLRKGLGKAHERPPARKVGMRVPVGGEVRQRPQGTGTQGPVSRYEAKMHAGNADLQASRRQGHSVQVLVPGGVHSVGLAGATPSELSRGDLRPDRLQRPLRAGEPPAGGLYRAGAEHLAERVCGVHGAAGCQAPSLAPRQDRQARVSAIAGRAGAEAPEGAERRGGTDQAGENHVKVYDILNAGPRSRFTVSGVVVSNCRDTYWTWRLSHNHREQMYLIPSQEPPYSGDDVRHARLGQIATWVSMPTVASMTAVEQRGFMLDTEWTQQRLTEEETTARDLLADMASRFNIEGTPSTAPTSHWFGAWTQAAVDEDQLRVIEITPNGKPSWSKRSLRKQAAQGNELAQLVLDQRGATKRAEYLRSWLGRQVAAGTIHARYNIGSVATGRLCISPDSLIDMPRDMTKYPHGVPLRDVKAGDWVYSFDRHMELTLRQVEWVGATKVDKTVIVTVENSAGERRTLQCTPDHLVRLYNGDWRHAEYLLNGTPPSYLHGGQRVLSMVRRGWKEPNGNDRYLSFFPHSNSRQTPPSVSGGARYGSTSGGRNTEHRWVMSKILGRNLSSKWDVHHRDGNKVNNHPSNLEYLPRSEHRGIQDETWGREQPGTETYMGPTDFRVVSVEEGPTIEVWDMTIPEDHQFIANGIVVHNSSSEPNMQQVTSSLKPAFIPRPGYLIAELDYCLEGSMRVLTSDLRWVAADQLKVGEKVIGFPEKVGKGAGRTHTYEEAEVTSLRTIRRPSVILIMEDGRQLRCSAEHRWLSFGQGKGHPRRWVEAQHLQPGDIIPTLTEPWEEPDPVDAAYLRGFLDGEGWVSQTVTGWGQLPGAVRDEVVAASERLGISWRQSNHLNSGVEQHIVTTMNESLRILGMIRPHRLLPKARQVWEGRQTYGKYNTGTRVAQVIPAGEQNVIAVGTSTKTMIVEGFLSHNSQIELRVAAFISRSQTMIEAYQRGDDLHRIIAANTVNMRLKAEGAPLITPADVTGEQRQGGKASNFGLLYGQEPYGFRLYAEDVYGVVMTEHEAVQAHAAFFDTWTGLREWHLDVMRRVRRDGYIVSPLGRIRRLPGIWDGYDKTVRHAENAAINSPVQGMASDMMQMSIASILGYLPGSEKVAGAHPIATVHDSIVLEVRESDWQSIVEEAKQRMQTVDRYLSKLDVDFDVPLQADATVGTRWGLGDVRAD